MAYFETREVKKIGIRIGNNKFIYNVENKEKQLYSLSPNGETILIDDTLLAAKIEKELLSLLNVNRLEDLKIFKSKIIKDKLKKQLDKARKE